MIRTISIFMLMAVLAMAGSAIAQGIHADPAPGTTLGDGYKYNPNDKECWCWKMGWYSSQNGAPRDTGTSAPGSDGWYKNWCKKNGLGRVWVEAYDTEKATGGHQEARCW